MNNPKATVPGTKGNQVPAVDLSARILQFLSKTEAGQANLTEICRALGIYKSRGHAILQTLTAHGLVERNEATKRYGLGPAVLTLSRAYLRNLDIRQAALPRLETLARETGGTALLGLVSGDSCFVVAKKDGPAPLGITIETGHRFPLTAGAHGKAIVAFLPEAARTRILKRRHLYFHGKPEALQMERLLGELAACREQGYALDMGELQPGIHAAAAPVFSGKGEVLGALIVVGLFPMEAAPRVGGKVRDAAADLSRALGAHLNLDDMAGSL